VDELERVADELYGGDPDEFIPVREAAVKAAKASKDKVLAAALGRLRKPTRSAWLVNLVARAHPDRAASLSDLAARLAAATAAADVPALRAAGAERAALVADLTRVAVGLGTARGYDGGETVRAEVATTLQAALADAEVLAQVLAGRVEKAQVYAGFGFGFSAPEPVEGPVPEPVEGPVPELVEGPVPEPVEGLHPVPELAQPVPESAKPVPETVEGPVPEPVEGLHPVPELAQPVPESAKPVPELVEGAAMFEARQKVERWTALLAEAVASREEAEAADAEAQTVLDRASQEVADLRTELKAAEVAELAARERATTVSDDLHDARTAEQQAKAALDRARRVLAGL
jgi:hypothetical protein